MRSRVENGRVYIAFSPECWIDFEGERDGYNQEESDWEGVGMDPQLAGGEAHLCNTFYQFTVDGHRIELSPGEPGRIIEVDSGGAFLLMFPLQNVERT